MSDKIKNTENRETIIQVDGIELCTESFGSPQHPAILLIMGAAASMVWWDVEFCRQLADKGRFVIRYDNRDVGRSTAYPLGAPAYGMEDMADDALRVLNHYKIDKAHFVGMSLGGMIAQLVALRNPERMLTMTLISSSVWDTGHDLPPIDKKVLDYHANGKLVNWSDEQSAVKYMAGGWKLLNGSKHPFDEKQATRLAETEYHRARSFLSMFNHALLKGGESYYGKASFISMPALVIHGTEDPVLPFPHGKALERAIPNARLIALEGRGHEIHHNDWDYIIESIAAHTA